LIAAATLEGRSRDSGGKKTGGREEEREEKQAICSFDRPIRLLVHAWSEAQANGGMFRVENEGPHSPRGRRRSP